jgi:hypothetical protein
VSWRTGPTGICLPIPDFPTDMKSPLFAFAFAALFGITAPARSAEKPNIVFVMADDMGWGPDRLSGTSFAENAEPRRDGGEWTAFRAFLCRWSGLFTDAGLGVDGALACPHRRPKPRLRPATSGKDHRPGSPLDGIRDPDISANGTSTGSVVRALPSSPVILAVPVPSALMNGSRRRTFSTRIRCSGGSARSSRSPAIPPRSPWTRR